MDWKKFKKNNVSLNYTVMLLPHSQKKPIHFKIPVWVFSVIFLSLLVLVGTMLFFAGSSHQLKQVAEEKRLLELEWQRLTVEKKQVEEQYYALQDLAAWQGQELQGLEEKTNETLKELQKLYARESEIRSQAGLSNPEGETPDTSEAVIDQNVVSSSYVPQSSPGSNDIEIVRNNLDILQLGVAQQYKKYDDLSMQIQSVKDAAAAEENRKVELRNSIVNYALKFVGNRYVYGGTDPNTGADCSGFTGYVMRNSAGVYLNRTSTDQSGQGTAVSASEIRPGDLVFYGNGSSINHVAIYIGNGQIVHASSEKTGIKISNWNYRTPVKIRNVLGD